ncbi:MAG: hypothetical protein QNK03_01315 [Myxococcota bacterium]|nr:hypothetical protein [Myxococcota bacterium]
MHEEPDRPSARCAQRIPESLDRLIHAAPARQLDDRPSDVDMMLKRLDAIAADLAWEETEAAA